MCYPLAEKLSGFVYMSAVVSQDLCNYCSSQNGLEMRSAYVTG